MPKQLPSTPARVLATAEGLFAARGYAGVSLREITAAAGVNLAAVNYHHSDKETLYCEILRRRLRELAQARAELLAAAEARMPGAPPPLAEVIDALARPLLVGTDREAGHSSATRRLLGRALTEPLPFTESLVSTELQPSLTRFGQALRRYSRGMAPADFVWTYSLLIGALHHSAATLHNMKRPTQGICRDDDGESALAAFRSVAIATFSAKELSG